MEVFYPRVSEDNDERKKRFGEETSLAMDDDNLPSPATEMKEKLISSFIKTTASSREETTSFLETHQWDLDAAVSAFTENNFSDVADELNILNPSFTQLLSGVAARTRYSHIPVSSHSTSNSYDYYIPSPSGIWLRPPSQANLSRDRNPFSSKRAADTPCESETLKRRKLAGNKPTLVESSGESNDSDSDDYNGGEQGETTIMEESEEGDDDDDKDEESDVERPVQYSSRIVSAEPQEVVTSIVTMWRNGFTFDDSPLKTLDNPENATFIETVQKLESPRDLKPEDDDVDKTHYRIKLIKRLDEDFNEPPNPNTVTPFQGVGRTLAESDSAATESPASSESLTTTPQPSMSLVVDPAAPTTSIQVRLADGTRIVARFNSHHTVRDVRGFIDAYTKEGGSNDYQLLVGFPPKPLLDIDQTIEKAGISNSVLIQKCFFLSST